MPTKYRDNVFVDGESYGRFTATILVPPVVDPHDPEGIRRTPTGPSQPSPIPGGVPQHGGAPGFGDVPVLIDRKAQHEALKNRLTQSYEDRVSTILKDINSRHTGEAVLSAIELLKRKLTIQPWLGGGTPDSPNARTIAQHIQAVTAKGRLTRDDDEKPRRPWRLGTGQGDHATIEYLPEDFAKESGISDSRHASKLMPGANQEEALLHELVHALRFMAGTVVDRRPALQEEMDSIEEVYAILIPNIYRSESGQPGLRANHRNFEASRIKTDEEFLKVPFNRIHLRRLRRQHPKLFEDLSVVPAKFNPIRRFAR